MKHKTSFLLGLIFLLIEKAQQVKISSHSSFCKIYNAIKSCVHCSKKCLWIFGDNITLVFISGSCRVTLVVAFGFLPQNFGTKNGTLLFYECRLSVGDTQRWWGHLNPSCCNQIRLNILHSNGGDTKHLPCTHAYPRARLHRIRQVGEPPCETFTTWYLALFHCWYRLKFNV